MPGRRASLPRCVWGQGWKAGDAPVSRGATRSGAGRSTWCVPSGRAGAGLQPARGWRAWTRVGLAWGGRSVRLLPSHHCGRAGQEESSGSRSPETNRLCVPGALRPLTHLLGERGPHPSPSSPALTSCVWSGTRWTPCRCAARGLGLCAELGGPHVGPGRQARKGRSTVVDSTLVLRSGSLVSSLLRPTPGVARSPLPPESLAAVLQPTPSPSSGARPAARWCWSPGPPPSQPPSSPVGKQLSVRTRGGPASAWPPSLLTSRSPPCREVSPCSSLALPCDLSLGLRSFRVS